MPLRRPDDDPAERRRWLTIEIAVLVLLVLLGATYVLVNRRASSAVQFGERVACQVDAMSAQQQRMADDVRAVRDFADDVRELLVTPRDQQPAIIERLRARGVPDVEQPQRTPAPKPAACKEASK